jgi:hypothetical protein
MLSQDGMPLFSVKILGCIVRLVYLLHDWTILAESWNPLFSSTRNAFKSRDDDRGVPVSRIITFFKPMNYS